MTQQWVTGYHLPTSLLSTAMIINGEPPKCWRWMPLAQCGSSGSLGRNNEKDICTLVLKMGLVIVLAPHIRQTWSYLKLNKIRPTNRLKAKHLLTGTFRIFQISNIYCFSEVKWGYGQEIPACSQQNFRLPAVLCLFCLILPKFTLVTAILHHVFLKKGFFYEHVQKSVPAIVRCCRKGWQHRRPRCHVGTRQENLGNILWSTLPLCIITCPSVWQCSTWIQGSLPTFVSSLIQELVMNRLMFFTCLHKVQLITYTCG